jgi:bifunctional non-homologous end joining protein LigD
MSLTAYVRKRDFKRTAEPKGRRKRVGAAGRSFVIQKHAASRLHYDFRLEMGGTLKSWAVPKGVPFKKGEKRLAVHVEDHPLEYAGFEGVIPQGQYGGGTVMVWDAGAFEPLGTNPQKELGAGKLHFRLHGKKLEGEWTLVRTRGDEKEQWLLIKSGDDVRPISKRKDDESVLTGRSMAQIAKERNAEWTSKGERKREPMRFIPAMKATLRAEPPTDGLWQYELKYDGYRTLALKDGNAVQLFSLNAKDFGRRFPQIAAAVTELPVEQAAFDGEIVALDEEGRSSFGLLQALEMGDERPPLAFYIFDLLHLDGEDLTRRPLHERRTMLAKIMRRTNEPLRYSGEIAGNPRQLLKEVCKRNLEGVIGKEADSPYEPGVRSRSWIKLKCVAEQELVIGGYTLPEGARKHFGALLVGYFEKGALKFAGKVGTGFNVALLKSLHRRMEALRQHECPFVNLPAKDAGRWAQNITPAEMKRCRWIRPEIVCQVRFGEWTRDGKLRHSVFVGVREDKDAREVVRERASR